MASYYARNSTIKHVHSTCSFTRLKQGFPVDHSCDDFFIPCKCFKTQKCIICLEYGRWKSTPCRHDHYICPCCFDEHVELNLVNAVKCPCNEGENFPLCVIPRNILEKQIENKTNTRIITQVQYIEDYILTLHCPNCERAFDNFDGCLGIFCECRMFFCALCFKRYTSSTSIHAHVLTCKFNDNKSYYMEKNKWDAHIKQIKQSRLVEYINSCDEFLKIHLIHNFKDYVDYIQLNISSIYLLRHISLIILCKHFVPIMASICIIIYYNKA